MNKNESLDRWNRFRASLLVAALLGTALGLAACETRVIRATGLGADQVEIQQPFDGRPVPDPTRPGKPEVP